MSDFLPPPAGSSVHGIFQVRILEWVAILFSRGSSHSGIEPASAVMQADSLLSEPPGKPVLPKVLSPKVWVERETSKGG